MARNVSVFSGSSQSHRAILKLMSNEKSMMKPKKQLKSSVNSEMQLAYDADRIVAGLRGRLIQSEELSQLTRELGLEMASMVLYRSILKSPMHGSFFHRVNQAKINRDKKNIEIVVVASTSPGGGLSWGQHIDFIRQLARAQGFSTETIDTDPRATLSDNARMIQKELQTNKAENIVLVTLGRGSAEFRLLLQRRWQTPEEFSKVKAWLNIAGTVQGSRTHDLLLDRPLLKALEQAKYWLKSTSFTAFMEEASSNPIWRERLIMPPQMLIVSLIGIALFPKNLLANFTQLGEIGPNDGYSLCRDGICQPGLIYPIWGMSHQAEPVRLQPVLERMLSTLAEVLQKEGQRPQPAPLDY